MQPRVIVNAFVLNHWSDERHRVHLRCLRNECGRNWNFVNGDTVADSMFLHSSGCADRVGWDRRQFTGLVHLDRSGVDEWNGDYGLRGDGVHVNGYCGVSGKNV